MPAHGHPLSLATPCRLPERCISSSYLTLPQGKCCCRTGGQYRRLDSGSCQDALDPASRPSETWLSVTLGPSAVLAQVTDVPIPRGSDERRRSNGLRHAVRVDAHMLSLALAE